MTEEEYNQRKAAFEIHKDSLDKEPSGDVKKEYWVGCYSKDDWELIHVLLLEDGTLEDNIPNDHVDCPNDCRQSDTRAVYLLTDAEVTALKNHPLVKYVHINTAKYPGTYATNPDDIAMGEPADKTYRYPSSVQHKRDTSTDQNDYLPSSPPAYLLNRAGYNLLRPMQKIDPWKPGQSQTYTVSGFHTWTCPVGVTSVSVVCVGGGGGGYDDIGGGGGGLGYKNYISVSPGTGYTVGVGSFGNNSAYPDSQGGDSFFISTSIVRGGGGRGGGDFERYGVQLPGDGLGGTFTGDGGGNGGNGGTGGAAGGGGAGGYSGTGGAGGGPTQNGNVGAGGGGGGGAGGEGSYPNNFLGSSGGGVGLLGEGASGAAGSYAAGGNSTGAGGGSGGGAGANGDSGCPAAESGGDYGGGGGSGNRGNCADEGAVGAVRIIWGEGKEFPSDAVDGPAADSTILTNRVEQYGTGKDVDVIVCDEDMWFGHIEFQNPNAITDIKQSDNATAASTAAPANYVGTNVLKSGFATSSSTGTCELLDLVLDAPYYIDKEWFEADVGNRLMDRWDGTKVPVESVARSWWSNSSNRSAAFSSVGTVTIPAAYTRANSNGSNTAYHTGSGDHGTPCASQAYGRQYGWAYNANKWFLNLYGTNSVGFEAGFDMQKIFHQNKPVNPTHGNKNPTVSSNSWGLRQATLSSGYYYFRDGTTGGSGTSYSTRPAFMANFYNTAGSSRCNEYVDGHAAITAGDEMVAAGVIFVCAAGNHNQKLVQSDHADYNNYYASAASTNYVDAKTNSVYSLMGYTPTYNSVNRPGFPQQIGVDRGTTPYTYKTIAIGALDDDHTASGLERKASYSNMGNAVDCFAPGDQTLSASDDNETTRFNRYDAYYDIVTTASAESEDKNFGGTSSACPITAGIIATKLENNRSWTYAEVKDWLSTNVENTLPNCFYQGTEATTATDSSNWGDDYNLQGAELKIVYDAHVPTPPPVEKNAKALVTGSNLSISGNFSIT